MDAFGLYPKNSVLLMTTLAPLNPSYFIILFHIHMVHHYTFPGIYYTTSNYFSVIYGDLFKTYTKTVHSGPTGEDCTFHLSSDHFQAQHYSNELNYTQILKFGHWFEVQMIFLKLIMNFT